ncbi:MAG: bactofilin family protein [Salinivirgaceae bacterium]|jgi:cytoskeletal protein CcmA (bactofilin family)|nr:polymer-forming cytoskeletal protein [Bacteroidales bacterium]
MGKINNTVDINSINIICRGTTINGDITTDGEIRIDGVVEGNLHAKGKVVIGTSGRLNGEIVCRSADIEGKVEGKINVNELLSFKNTCVFKGDIVTKQLSIEPGATFNGTCQMSNNIVQNTEIKNKQS